MDKYQVFISYRREGGDALAGRLADRLKMMGYKVFFDIETMRSGTFNTQILDAIEECQDVLVVLPPNALDRCMQEDDWVRQELAFAFRQNKNVIPILMRGFIFPQFLPSDIIKLKYMEGVVASSEYFDAVMEHIENLLLSNTKRKQSKQAKAESIGQENKNSSDLDGIFEEVYFYKQMSRERKEAIYTEKVPIFYQKAVGLINKMLEAGTEDYRIWWELSKPMDYDNVEEVQDYQNKYAFDDDLFYKALDYANIETKKRMIMDKDNYDSRKADMLKAYQESIAVKESEVIICEQPLPEESVSQNNEENWNVERLEEVSQSVLITEDTGKRDSVSLNNSYFVLNENDSEQCICAFVNNNNLLNLNVYIKNVKQKKTVRVQSVFVKIDKEGRLRYSNNKPIKVFQKGKMQELDIALMDDGWYVWDKKLMDDPEYVNELIKKAAKPLFGSRNILL